MVASVGTRNMRDGYIKIVDGTPTTPLYLQLQIDEGNLNWDLKNPRVKIKNRGVLDHVRDGDQMEVDLSFTVLYQQYEYSDGSSTGISVIDTLLKQGGASAWLTTGQAFESYCTNLEFYVANPGDTSKHEKLVFAKFRQESIKFSEAGDANKLAISGFAWITAPARTYA